MYTIKEVTNKISERLFIEMAPAFYAGDVKYIRPLDNDIKAVFDKNQNKFFRHGECARFILFDENQKPVGRIAVFINHKTSKREEQPTGGIGFFECINNREAAHQLFDHCKQWLQQRGMEAMDGPINFGERDSWWGLLVDGFNPPPYKINYNPPYYQDLFESYGFKTYFEQWCYSMKVQGRMQQKFYDRHKTISENKDYRAEHIRKKNIAKYAEHFRIVYNKAWVKHGSGKELDSRLVLQFFKKMKPVIDEKIIWYVYYKNEPVACWVNLPDINQIFKKFNGKFGWLQKLQFFFLFRRKKNINKLFGLVFGVIPEHQGKGVDSFIIVEGGSVIQHEKLYDDYEMQWIGDFNPKMITIAENLGTHKSRVLKTYRYLFDQSKEFKRHPII